MSLAKQGADYPTHTTKPRAQTQPFYLVLASEIITAPICLGDYYGMLEVPVSTNSVRSVQAAEPAAR